METWRDEQNENGFTSRTEKNHSAISMPPCSTVRLADKSIEPLGAPLFMSGRRMVYDKLFSNEELSDVPVEARYLYIAMIVHADDDGRMRADAKYLKVKAFPFDSCRTEDVLGWRNELSIKTKLICIYESEGKEYLYHPHWHKWQILRKDRMKPSDCPEPATKCQPDDNQVSTQCRHKEVREVKEVKITEGKEVEVKEVKELPAFASQGSTSTPKKREFPKLPADLEVEVDPIETLKKLGRIKPRS